MLEPVQDAAEPIFSEPQPAPHSVLRGYMPELDTVRGIAVLLVLLYHGMAPSLGAPMSHLGTALFSIAQYG